MLQVEFDRPQVFIVLNLDALCTMVTQIPPQNTDNFD